LGQWGIVKTGKVWDALGGIEGRHVAIDIKTGRVPRGRSPKVIRPGPNPPSRSGFFAIASARKAAAKHQWFFGVPQ